MKKLEWWDIKRSDKRERCARCLKVFKKGEFKKQCPEFNGYRFTRTHLGCFTKEEVI